MYPENEELLDLSLVLSQRLDFAEEGYGFATEFTATLRCYDFEAEAMITVGILTGFVFDFSASMHITDNGIDLTWLLDLKGEYDEYTDLFDLETAEYCAEVEEMTELLGCSIDTLILHKLAIHQQYSGRGFTAVLMRHVIRRLGGGSDLVALHAVPLQFKRTVLDEFGEFAKALTFDELPSDEQTAGEKLRAYYTRLGFRSLPSNPRLMILEPHELCPVVI